jgi:hypothetical protein
LSSFKKIVLARRVIKRRRSGQRRKLARSPVLPILRRGARAGRRQAGQIMTDPREEPRAKRPSSWPRCTRLVVDDEVERERAREAAGLDEEDDEP